MDAESEYIEKLKTDLRLAKAANHHLALIHEAEVVRLKDELHGEINRSKLYIEAQEKVFLLRMAEKDAEIERLRQDHQIVRNFLDAADAKLLKQEKRIAELCDEMEQISWRAEDRAKIIQRARKEATR